jgi:hypothetical protein
MSTSPDVDPRAIETRIEEAISVHGRLEPGELIVHYDLVVLTRRIDDDGDEPIRRHHWARTGSDPHLSYGALRAAAKRVMYRLR